MGNRLSLALTCSLTSEGEADDIFKAKLEREPPRPSERAPDLPRDLDALCAALLRRVPSERPGADEIRTRLGIEARTSMFPGEGRAVFVGRGAELNAMVGAFEEATHGGRARGVLAGGEPGIGKGSL